MTDSLEFGLGMILATGIWLSVFLMLGIPLAEHRGRVDVASGEYECTQAYEEWECRRAGK